MFLLLSFIVKHFVISDLNRCSINKLTFTYFMSAGRQKDSRSQLFPIIY